MFKRLFRKSMERTDTTPVLHVLYRKGEDGYIVAECPQLPGCMSQGKTRDEARRNIVDAMRSVLAVQMESLVSNAPCEESATGGAREEKFRLKEPDLIAV